MYNSRTNVFDTYWISCLINIFQEDSDDLRSQSSASDHRFGASSAQSSVRAPSADVVEQVDSRISQILENVSEGEESTPVASRRESIPEILSEASESLPESDSTVMHPRITQVRQEEIQKVNSHFYLKSIRNMTKMIFVKK